MHIKKHIKDYLFLLLACFVLLDIASVVFNKKEYLMSISDTFVFSALILWVSQRLKVKKVFYIYISCLAIGHLCICLAFLNYISFGFCLLFFSIGLLYFYYDVFSKLKFKKTTHMYIFIMCIFSMLNLFACFFTLSITIDFFDFFGAITIIIYGLTLVTFISTALYYYLIKTSKKSKLLVSFGCCNSIALQFIAVYHFYDNNNTSFILVGNTLYLFSIYFFYTYIKKYERCK